MTTNDLAVAQNNEHYPNLKNFPKGKSGNPGGKAKNAVSITAHDRTRLATIPKEYPDPRDPKAKPIKNTEGLNWAAIIAHASIANAAAGDNHAIKDLKDRVDGKVPTILQHGGERGNPVRVKATIIQAPEEKK